jgi:hypothetical protein
MKFLTKRLRMMTFRQLQISMEARLKPGQFLIRRLRVEARLGQAQLLGEDILISIHQTHNHLLDVGVIAGAMPIVVSVLLYVAEERYRVKVVELTTLMLDGQLITFA